jgi:hypothetical protein
VSALKSIVEGVLGMGSGAPGGWAALRATELSTGALWAMSKESVFGGIDSVAWLAS